MSDFIGTEHGITFTEVDLINNEFISHLTLCVGKTYEEAIKFFEQIKHAYPKHDGEPEMVIDFIDTDWSIIDDYSISKEHARHLLMRMGHVPKF